MLFTPCFRICQSRFGIRLLSLLYYRKGDFSIHRRNLWLIILIEGITVDHREWSADGLHLNKDGTYAITAAVKEVL